MSEGTKRNISVVKDADGNKIVVINDIIFKKNYYPEDIILQEGHLCT